MNEKYSRLIKDTGIFAIGNFGSKIILFFLVPLYTNYLSKAEYGISEYVFTISSLIVPVVSVSIWEGIVRMGLKKQNKKEDILFNSFIVFLFSAAIILITTPLWKLYAPISPWRGYLSLYSLVYVLNQIELNYVKIKDLNKLYAIASISQTLVLALLNIVLLVKYDLGIVGYLLSNIIAILFADILIIITGGLYSDLTRGRFNHALLKDMTAYSAPLVINNISWWIIHSSDKMMIEAMLSDSDLGLYTVASKIPSLINVFVSVFTQAWGLSSIREMESTNDTGYYKTVFLTYSVFLFSCILVLSTIVKPFMSVYVGKEFISAWRFVPLLFYAAAFQALSSYFGGLLGALQNSFRTMTTTVTGSIVNIVLNYVFISIIGVWGALVGTVTAFVVITAIRAVLVEKALSVNIPWIKVVAGALVCLIQAVFVSMDFHILICSLVSIAVFAIVFKSELVSIISTIIAFFKKHAN